MERLRWWFEINKLAGNGRSIACDCFSHLKGSATPSRCWPVEAWCHHLSFNSLAPNGNPERPCLGTLSSRICLTSLSVRSAYKSTIKRGRGDSCQCHWGTGRDDVASSDHASCSAQSLYQDSTSCPRFVEVQIWGRSTHIRASCSPPSKATQTHLFPRLIVSRTDCGLYLSVSLHLNQRHTARQDGG